VIAKLDNCNNNESGHGWSEQEIHEILLLPRKWACN
jgi:hypothetical protein